MKKIKVLGMSCTNCKTTLKLIEVTAKEGVGQGSRFISARSVKPKVGVDATGCAYKPV